ncbi:MAG: STAS domain-containing protein [Acidobacteria bacterium]|nr:STAS domain-containing protein [Acidobacteriota bacterium]MCB9396377.1 STAS domain-containing protein [Acidobacteriota bacterium]
MKINASDIDDITVLEIDGMITLGSDAPLSTMFHQQIERGRRKLVLDMTKVKYIDSIGMGQLAGGYTALDEVGGSMVLARTNPKIKELLKLTGLQNHIVTYETVEDALDAL